MNLVDGATTFPVLVGSGMSLAGSEDVVRRMEAVGWGDLAVVVARNLSMTRSLHAVDALLLVLRVQEVRNFEWWELSGPLCHLVCSLQTEHYSAEDTL